MHTSFERCCIKQNLLAQLYGQFWWSFAKTNKETATKPTDNKHKNSTTERIKTQSKGGFNAGSFIGGIVLVICASLVTFYGVRYYKAYKDGRPFSFRIFNNNHGFAARQDTDDPGFPF